MCKGNVKYLYEESFHVFRNVVTEVSAKPNKVIKVSAKLIMHFLKNCVPFMQYKIHKLLGECIDNEVLL